MYMWSAQEVNGAYADGAMNNPMQIRQEIQERIKKCNFNVSRQTEDQIAHLENQNEVMRKIQSSALEIQRVMEEMNALVLEQGDMLNDIEDHIEETRVHVSAGTKQIEQAKAHKTKARKRGCCLFFLCSIILLILILVYVVK